MHRDKSIWTIFLMLRLGQLPMWMATEAIKKYPPLLALLSPRGGIFKNPTIKQVAKTVTSRHETFVSNEFNWKCIIGFRIASFPSQDQWQNHNYLPTWSYYLKVKATQNCWSQMSDSDSFRLFACILWSSPNGRTGMRLPARNIPNVVARQLWSLRNNRPARGRWELQKFHSPIHIFLEEKW